jgi:hypothetical protein
MASAFKDYLGEDQNEQAHQVPPTLTPDDVGQIERELIWEKSEVMAGKRENSLLTEAMAGNWTADHLIQVARRRGMNWRMSSALADKLLQLQGYALLDLMADAVGRDLAVQVMRKSIATWARAKQLIDDARQTYGDQEFFNRLWEEYEEDMATWAKNTRERNSNRLRKLLE